MPRQSSTSPSASVLRMMRDAKCDTLDIKFIDMPGTWQHVALPIGEVNEDLFIRGTGFDGSSIRGFQVINESDMLLLPDASTAVVDPFAEKTVSIIADVRDPGTGTGKEYSRDPRWIAKKAEKHLADTGLGDVSYWGPELEFFIFDSARFAQDINYGYYYIESDEGIWNSGQETMLDGYTLNMANRPRVKQGYFPAQPIDTLHDIRGEMVRVLVETFGVIVEKHHHEVATGGQGEIDMRYTTLTKMADQVMEYKYTVKNVAKRHGKIATFMAKPLFNDNGTGMHTHQSIWKGGRPLFAGREYAGISKMALNYIGGLIKHGPALMAFCAPTMNSYKRLVPGFEAPTILALSARNRSAACRIPMYFPDAKAKRVEFRPPDPTCNPYLAFSAMLMAGLDGIDKKMDPGQPLDVDLYELSTAELSKLNQVPGSLAASLDALEKDHDFLLQGGVFTRDLLEMWIEYKRKNEIDPIRLRPHPYEFFLSFDA